MQQQQSSPRRFLAASRSSAVLYGHSLEAKVDTPVEPCDEGQYAQGDDDCSRQADFLSVHQLQPE